MGVFSFVEAWGHVDRTDVGEHGHWPGAGVRHQGLPLHHHAAREDEQGKGEAIERTGVSWVAG